MADTDEIKDDFMDLLSLRDLVEDPKDAPETKKDIKDENLITVESLTQEQLEAMALTEILKAIGNNVHVLENLKDMLDVGGDPEVAGAYAMVAKANSDSIKAISEFALQKERIKSQKELKRMDIEGKKEIITHKFEVEGPSGLNTLGGSNNTFILSMNRDEIFDQVLKRKEPNIAPAKCEVKDIEVEEIEEETPTIEEDSQSDS